MNASTSASDGEVLDHCGRYFRKHGYGVLRGVLSPSEAELCANYALIQTAMPDYFKVEDALGSQGRYADALAECLLLKVHPIMERVAGGALIPCYSYLRIYHSGAELPKHLDRPSCEISTSLTLGMESPESWPLCLEADGKTLALHLAPGDMLLYRGADLPHWRERFEGKYWVQVFLHYVRADGEYAEFGLDGRDAIGPFDPSRQRRRFDAAQGGAEGADADAAAPQAAPIAI